MVFLKEHLCFDITFGDIVFCKRDPKDNSNQNNLRKNTFLKDKKNMSDSEYSENESKNSFEKNEDTKTDNLD